MIKIVVVESLYVTVWMQKKAEMTKFESLFALHRVENEFN